MRQIWTLLKTTATEFSEDDCASMAAALAYYMVFSLAPLLVLIVMLVSLVWEPTQVQGQVQGQMNELFGQQGAQQVQTMMNNASQNRSGLAAAWGLIALLVGATGLFSQLQTAMNRAWEVAPDPEQSGVKDYLFKRLLSFGMILLVALLLFASLLLSAILSAFGQYIGALLPGEVSQTALQGFNFGVSFLVIMLLFAAMFKWLPDAKITWKDSLFGAVVTALLFVIGTTLIGLYLAHTNMTSGYGAAGSLVLVLIWIYYSALILLLGVEFTQVWARRYGGQIQPKEGAVRVVRQKQQRRAV